MRAFRLAYDGAPFRGFQRQPDVETVEGVLFDALAELGLYDPDDPKPAGYSAAGRTDAGVSALAQTVAFECPDWCSPSALNAELPGTVRAWASADVPEEFHATRDASRRTYVYHLHAPAGDAWGKRGSGRGSAGTDDDRLATAADRLAGEHDFHNLTSDDEGTVRAIDLDVARNGEFVAVRVSAGGFPRQLVRRLVTLLSEVGTGARDLEALDRALASEPLSGHEGVPPAPAHPLVLVAVDYEVAFDVDPAARDDAAERFSARRVERLGRARAAGTVLDGL